MEYSGPTGSLLLTRGIGCCARDDRCTDWESGSTRRVASNHRIRVAIVRDGRTEIDDRVARARNVVHRDIRTGDAWWCLVDDGHRPGNWNGTQAERIGDVISEIVNAEYTAIDGTTAHNDRTGQITVTGIRGAHWVGENGCWTAFNREITTSV